MIYFVGSVIFQFYSGLTYSQFTTKSNNRTLQTREHLINNTQLISVTTCIYSLSVYFLGENEKRGIRLGVQSATCRAVYSIKRETEEKIDGHNFLKS